MSDVFLSQPAFAVGNNRYTVDESAAMGRTVTEPHQLRAAGFVHHHVSDEEQTVFDLAMLTAKEIDVVGTDAIVFGTCLPANANIATADRFLESRDVKDVMEFPVSRLQSHLCLETASVFGLTQQGCTNSLGMLRLARALLVAEPHLRKVLCVTADRFPSGALYEQAFNLISDGSAGCIVTKEAGEMRVVACHQITNGALVAASDDETAAMYFAYTHRLVSEILTVSGKDVDDVSWIVPQNTNVAAWEVMSSLLGVDPHIVWCPSLPDVGHVISADNFINLRLLQESGRLHSGQLVLLVMAGYGMNWQATLLEIA